jgi:hypothetical protein
MRRDPRVIAYRVGNVESFRDGDVAAVKKGVGCGRFFMLAAGAPAGERRFTGTIIRMPAFPAGKTMFPFLPGNEFQARLLIREKGAESFRIKFLKTEVHMAFSTDFQWFLSMSACSPCRCSDNP